MPMLTPTKIAGTVTWLGTVGDREASIASAQTDRVEVGWEGFVGDCHAGLTRPACVRVRTQYAKGTEIANTRQITIVSEEELAEVAEHLGIPAVRAPWLGASMVLRGIPDFTLIPPSARLMFSGGVALVVDMENAPCKHPAELIEAAHPGHGRAFPQVARNKRGITAWVEHPGSIGIGESVTLHVPPQRLYPHV